MIYKKILTSVWTDDKFPHFTDDEKLLCFYLFTSPHANMIGLYRMPLAYAAGDLGWTMERFNKPFTKLLSYGLFEWDQNSNLLLVKNFLKHDGLDNPNQTTKAINILNKLPVTTLFSSLLKNFKPLVKPYNERFIERLKERLGEPLPKPLYKQLTEPLPTNSQQSTDNSQQSTDIKSKDCANENHVCEIENPQPPVESVEKSKKPKAKKEPKVKSTAVCAYRDVFNLWPNKTQEEEIDATVNGQDQVARWSQICREWALRGFKPTSIRGMLDWFKGGVPDSGPKHAAGKVNDTLGRLAERIQRRREAVSDNG